MLSMKLISAVLLSSIVPFTTAQFNLCQFLGIDPFQCAYCGTQGSQPIRCYAANATFDDISGTNQPIGVYKNVDWTNFNLGTPPVTTANIVPHLKPYSKPNVAVLPAGKPGIVKFGVGGGRSPLRIAGRLLGAGHLFNFRYGCSSPSLPGLPPQYVPAPCSVAIDAVCYENNVFVEHSTTITYAGNVNGALSYFDYYAAQGSRFCVNTTFTATSAVGGLPIVDFVLDEVIFDDEYNL